MAQHRLNGSPVYSTCRVCQRQPKRGEVYGSGPHGWDHTNICPECWDKLFGVN